LSIVAYSLLALAMAPQAANGDNVVKEIVCDICVVGGGSGGFGAALAAARSHAQVVLIEKRPILGGTSTAAYVANWEPGPGCSFARELYERLAKQPGTVAIAPQVHSWSAKEPYGVPYRCLIPKDWKNVLIACRGAGFSHIAASSSRLSRTVMALGHAAGLAGADAASVGKNVRQVDVAHFVDAMGIGGRSD
jgi:glycine/D-amino acid oxidase-like deaminating enzyme